MSERATPPSTWGVYKSVSQYSPQKLLGRRACRTKLARNSFFSRHEVSHEKCSEILSEIFETYFVGPKKSHKIPPKFPQNVSWKKSRKFTNELLPARREKKTRNINILAGKVLMCFFVQFLVGKRKHIKQISRKSQNCPGIFLFMCFLVLWFLSLPIFQRFSNVIAVSKSLGFP